MANEPEIVVVDVVDVEVVEDDIDAMEIIIPQIKEEEEPVENEPDDIYFVRTSLLTINPVSRANGIAVAKFSLGKWTPSEAFSPDIQLKLVANLIKADESTIDDKNQYTDKLYTKTTPRKKSPWKGWKSYEFVELVGSVENVFPFETIRSVCSHLRRISASFAYSLVDDEMFFHLLIKPAVIVDNITIADSHIRTLFAYNDNEECPINALNSLLAVAYSNELLDDRVVNWEMRKSDPRDSFKQVFEALRMFRNPPPNYRLNLEGLASTLRPYQLETVQWMIHRELHPELDFTRSALFSNFAVIGGLHYYPRLGTFCRSVVEPPTGYPGGILAEEMGLGKTVELLALILAATPEHIDEITVAKDGLEVNKSAMPSEFDYDDMPGPSSRKPQNDKKKGPSFSKNALKNYADEDDEDNSNDQFVYQRYQRRRAYDVNIFFNAHNRFQTKGEPTVSCTECGTACPKQRMNWDSVLETAGIPFTCPDCVYHADPVKSDSTLIVVPEILIHQWCEEIKTHLKEDVQVDIYRGVLKDGYKHPQYLRRFKIVLCSYEVFRSEVDFVERQESRQERLRKRSYEAPKIVTSPLPKVDWWRICVDEGQLVESTASKAAVMCSHLCSRARWCATGTPLMTGALDLQGLLYYLKIFPYSDDSLFHAYLGNYWKAGDVMPLSSIVGQLFWRNSKDAVKDQLGIPETRHETVDVNFTAVEERFYQEKLFFCLNKMQATLLSMELDHGSLLADLSERKQKALMDVLNAVRLCIITGDAHIINQRHGVHTYTPEALFHRLVSVIRARVEEQARSYIASMNGYAGLCALYHPELSSGIYEHVFEVEKQLNEVNRLMNFKSSEEIEKFRAEQEKKEIKEVEPIKKLQVDHFQIVHVGKALGRLQEKGHNINFDINMLQERIEKSSIQHCQNEIASMIIHKSDWLENEAEWKKYDKAFDRCLSWIMVTFDQARKNGFNVSLLVKSRGWLSTILSQRLLGDGIDEDIQINAGYRLFMLIQSDMENYHGEMIGARRTIDDILEAMKDMDERLTVEPSIQMEEMMNCIHNEHFVGIKDKYKKNDHEDIDTTMPRSLRSAGPLGIKKAQNGDMRTICTLCRMEFFLERIEWATNVYKEDESRFSIRTIRSLAQRLQQYCPKEIPGFEMLKEWFTLAEKTAEVAKMIYPTALELIFRLREIRDASSFYEFNQKLTVPSILLRGQYRQVRTLLYCCTKTNEIELKREETAIIKQIIEVHKYQMEDEKASFSKSIAQLHYIHSTNQDNSQSRECPVCYAEVGMRWYVFPCAHLICVICFEQLKKTTVSVGNNALSCVSCRARCHAPQVSLVTQQKPIAPVNEKSEAQKDDEIGKLKLTVKFDAVARRVIELIRNRENKLLIFTSLADAVKPLCNVLSLAGVNHLALKSAQNVSIIDKFRKDAKQQVLVMTLAQCANGLNITEANHILFLEPTTEKSVVKQAIGRIERMGQRRAMTVHNFVVKGSVEEEIHRLVNDMSAEDGWTVGTLAAVFGL